MMLKSTCVNVCASMFGVLLLAGCGGGGSGGGSLFPVGITAVSLDSSGVGANDVSEKAAISSDGRYVVFTSRADNLVAGDSNSRVDAFVHDRLSGETSRESLASGGGQGNGSSSSPSISDDGRYVAFTSDSNNLVGVNDTNGVTDVFVHDRQTGGTTRVSVGPVGLQGNGSSVSSTISDDGFYVAFASTASNLVTGDTNGTSDIFVYNRQAGQTTRVSVDTGGVQSNGNSAAPSISTDGNYVAFISTAPNLVAGDTNGFTDVFVHDRTGGNTTRVSVPSGGVLQANGNSTGSIPAISADGNHIAFASSATNLVAGDSNGFDDIFVHDRTTGNTFRVSVASDGTQSLGHSSNPVISADGRHVAFDTNANNLVTGDSNASKDIFLHDRMTGTTTRISVNEIGNQVVGDSVGASISADGYDVAFASTAANVVVGTNGLNGQVYTVTLP
jgi:Tol biopolymer transport system component